MRRALGWVVALMAPAVLLTGSVDGAPKKALDKELDRNSDKMIRAGQVVGKVVAVYEDKRKVRVKVGRAVPEINASALSALQNAQYQMMQAQASRNIQSIRNAQIALIRAKATPVVTTKMHYQEAEIQAMDDVVVRTRHPRVEHDEKGRPKKLSKQELKELKGDDRKLPGYKAEFGDIQPEQIIMVQLVRKKGAAVKAPRPKKKLLPGEKDDLLGDLLDENEPQASMIVIEADPPPPPLGK